MRMAQFAGDWRACLSAGVAELGIELSDMQLNQLAQLLELLQKWSKAYNLTALSDPCEIVVKHFLDSLAVLPLLSWHSYLDVGCGAGFPCLPLAIASPEQQFTGLDSNGKKIRFVNKAINSLNLNNCQALQSRIESAVMDSIPQAVICRAFASLPDIVRLCDKPLQQGATLLAMKGKILESELDDLPEHVRIARIETLAVPYLEAERHLLVVEQAH